MKRLVFFLLAVCGCSMKPSDEMADDGGAIADGLTSQDAAGDGGRGFYCPAGTTLTPYMSEVRKASFAMADMVLAPATDYFAVVETNVGRIVLDLHAAQTPITVNSFVFLALNHFYDGIAFHRVLEGFVAQGGDPNTVDKPPGTWGTGGPGYQFGLEIVSGLNFDSRGVLGMARAAMPNTNGSQFFITLAAASSLDNMYTVFGKVTEGDATLDRIKRGAMPGGLVTVEPTRMQTVNICQKLR